MPYINRSRRMDLVQGAQPVTTGELNYLVTKLITKWLGKDPSYAAINAVIGVLECAKLELYRRIAAPYEDTKIEQNGDVY